MPFWSPVSAFLGEGGADEGQEGGPPAHRSSRGLLGAPQGPPFPAAKTRRRPSWHAPTAGPERTAVEHAHPRARRPPAAPCEDNKRRCAGSTEAEVRAHRRRKACAREVRARKRPEGRGDQGGVHGRLPGDVHAQQHDCRAANEGQHGWRRRRWRRRL